MKFFSPKAERYGPGLRRRLENRAVRVYDRYVLEEEHREAERILKLVRAQKEELSMRSEEEGVMGFYFTGHSGATDIEEDSVSTISTASKDGRVGVCGNVCQRLCTVNTRPYILKWWEFLPILMFLNTSITYNANCVELSVRWGALMVLITFIVMQILIASPLFMAYMFLASYSRRSYVGFWDCAPMLKGLGYSILLASLLGEVFNVAFTGLILFYLFITVTSRNVPWANCDFPNAHPECIPILDILEENIFRHNSTCCAAKECGREQQLQNCAKFSTLDYYISYVLKRGYEAKPLHDGLLPFWIATVVILWAMLCFFMTIGLRKFSKMFSILCIIALISQVPSVIATILLSSRFRVVKEMETDFKNLFNGKMWLDFTVHHLYREIPSDVIALSAHSVPAVSTTSDTVILFALKIFWGVLGIVWTAITARLVEQNYQIRDDLCVLIRGDLLIFVMMPDFIAWSPFGNLGLITFFVVVFIWNFSISVYILNNAVEALLDEFLILQKYRLPICLVTAAGLCAVNVQILSPDFTERFDDYVRNTVPTIISLQLIAAWIGLFLYSVPKIADDYHFMYAQKLSLYWTFGLKLGMLAFVILLMLLYYQNIGAKVKTWLCIIILWPIPIGVIIMILRFYMRINKSLLSPHPMWGPPSKKGRQARALFDPAHDLKYRSSVQKCKHRCLIRSSAFKREKKRCQTKLDLAIIALEQDNYHFRNSTVKLPFKS